VSAWYFNKNLKPQGPLSFEEIKKKILRGEIGPTDLVLKEGESHWRPAMEWRDFTQDLFPAFQKNLFKKSSLQEKEWILLIFTKEEGPAPSQEGPYSVEDLQGFLSTGRVSPEDYVWRSGLTGWVQIKDRVEFASSTISRDL